MGQMAAHIGQSRSEQKRMHPIPVIGYRMEEMKQHARVGFHRSRNIAEYGQRWVAPDAALFFKSMRPPERTVLRSVARMSMRRPVA